MEQVTGYVQSVVFYKENTKYTIARLKLDQKKDEKIVITGYFDPPGRQELCRFFGEYVDHPRYGRQFKVEYFEKLLPTSKEAIIRFLSSSLFAGVGSKTAEKIVDALGENCLSLIKENPSLLDDLSIKDSLKQSIINGIGKSNHLEEAIKLFVGHGIPAKYLIKMDAIYGDKLIPLVMNNPYILVRDIDGIGFKTADRVALSLGFDEMDSRRIASLIAFVCKEICYRTQDTYTSKEEIYRLSKKYLPDLDDELFNINYISAVKDRDLIDEDGRIFPSSLYDAENGIAKHLKSYLIDKVATIDEDLILKEIRIVEEELGISYSEEQIEAIIMCINNGVSIITGGPGTGKTTVVHAIIKVYERLFPNDLIKLCAPTGRASKRMNYITGKEATTIHRLLKWDLDTNKFSKNEDDPVLGDFIIIDEFSMVDCQLFYSLLRAIGPFSKILLIGDDKQLPPVSPGDVLRDLLELGLIPTVMLKKIHRQSANSGIIPLCYDVRQGEFNPENIQKDDVSFIECRNIDVKDYVLKLVAYAVDHGLSQQDIQILAPMYDGVAGITNLNDHLREFFNPSDVFKKEIAIGRTTYREGDKILQLKNQPDDDVYNGDIGTLVEINDEDNKVRLIIDFDGNFVTYTPEYFSNITHAYCISVHKSQGSEYKYVIMPILQEYSVMLRRKLIYTGISRAKENLTLLGSINMFKRGIATIEQKYRKTSLQERLISKLKNR